ncbi:DUF2141 domain-containing protein [Geomesophilobacter sediminis]|uniref:DUF2141 domain-containing protein n=1 Tax=Geomesophilobacter sediminis TaxID=2798584 RepID=A0A8J7S7Y6_9BACT|nr:DUF2141 domain-containing protein [Geomesophilobacter sediminis]MBJ6727237.1 DUF2141 domain-containing protein [Geomesophilobacter sediminis]
MGQFDGKQKALKRGSVVLLVLALCSIAAAAAAESLTVRVSGFKKLTGTVYVMLWRDAASFPTHPEKAVATRQAPVSGDSVQVTFASLPAGTYAAAAFQDLNGNGELDRSLLGWPVEPTGASNGARGTVGPPRFSDAAFELKQNRTIEIRVK